MKLTHCTEEYWEAVRALRNDPRVIEGFIKSEHITKAMQLDYMKKESKNYRVVVLNGKLAGYIGVIDHDIRICTHPDFHGKGIAKFMINEGLKIWPSAQAKVKVSNTRSLNLFKSIGFKEKFVILTKDKK